MAGDKQPLHRREVTRTPGTSTEPLPRRPVCTEYCLYKFLTVLYGVSYFMVGLIVLVIGVWIISIKRQFQAVNSILTCPAVMAIVVAILMLFTSAIGIIGGVKDKLLLLRSFLLLVIVVVIVQVSIGIIAFVFRDQVYLTLDAQMESAVEQYLVDRKLQYALDAVQQRFGCCGLHCAQNWELNDNFTCSNPSSNWSCSLPDSCCMRIRPNCGFQARKKIPEMYCTKKFKETMSSTGFYTEGCRKPFLHWIEYNLDVFGATSLAFSILHIIGIFFVYMLIVQEEDRERLFKYRNRYYNN